MRIIHYFLCVTKKIKKIKYETSTSLLFLNPKKLKENQKNQTDYGDDD